MRDPEAPHRDALRPAAGAGGRRAAHRVRRGVDPLAAQRHPPVGRAGQRQRRGARRRGNPPVHHHERGAAQGARGQPAGHRADARPAGSHHQELRPRHPAVPRDHAVRRGRHGAGDEPHRQAPRRGPEGRAPPHPGRVDVGDPRGRRSPAVHGVRDSPDEARRAGRLAGRAVQPRGDVADRRSHQDRRARLRAGPRRRTASWSRTATPTGRRSSRRRRT